MSGSGQSTLIQDSIRSRDRDSRYPPRASTPQSRAAVAAAGYQYERSVGKGQLLTGGSSSQLVGGTNGRYSRAGGGGGGGVVRVVVVEERNPLADIFILLPRDPRVQMQVFGYSFYVSSNVP